MKTHMDLELLNRVARRAHYLANQMIFRANHRANVEKGDPKVGGHSSASSSALHILGALHLVVKTGFDHIANKPHASPADHAYNYLLNLFLNDDLSRMDRAACDQAMDGLRAFPLDGEPVFQSYHSAYDPDRHNFFPSGTVGIPPVNAGYLAHAYNLAERHGYKVPKAHFWAIIGDSEFREGSLAEAIPDLAEREVGNLTWIIDYNRQSLDGHRITNTEIMHGSDDQRIQRTLEANGWQVIQVRHGRKRLEIFQRPGGEKFRQLFEKQLTDYELQVLLQLKEPQSIRDEILKYHGDLATFLKTLSDEELITSVHDLGGHDFAVLVEALEESKKNTKIPTMIIAHTLKGWGLEMAATPGNHSSLPDESEMTALRSAQGIKDGSLYQSFDEKSEEGRFLRERGNKLYADILAQEKLRQANADAFQKTQAELGEIPDSLDINLKLASYPHTQWMLGQLTAKLTRIANSSLTASNDKKALPASERPFKLAGEMLITMAPDVGTSTNLNPAMDGKIFGATVISDIETEFGVKDRKTPDLVPGEEMSDRFLRFEIAEANVMSCMGSYGRMRDLLGIPLLPLMTVYDFFVKRAHDQFFYNLYWKSSFICVGTPSGVTLSPEGAQHGWKSDFQIPNQITWEPFYCQELDWILTDSIRRHLHNDNQGRTGVFIRGVTRGVDQKTLLEHLRTQRRFKTQQDITLTATGFELPGGQNQATVPCLSDEDILRNLREDVLAGAYYLLDYRGYAGYEPGDNVIHLFAMGSLGTEAIKASAELLKKGIYANVIMVTSPDLLLGNLAHETQYRHLRQTLGVDATLYLQPRAVDTPADLATLAGRRIPIVSTHDGEVGLLDNIGSVIGVRHEALGVRKHSRSGRPDDIYKYHHIDASAVVEAALQVLSETALELVEVQRSALQ
jgi:pyruvate dehydrogenase E1 component